MSAGWGAGCSKEHARPFNPEFLYDEQGLPA